MRRRLFNEKDINLFIRFDCTFSRVKQSVSHGNFSEDIAKLAYEWEKANFDRDYEREQELIYKDGSYEIHKTTKKIDSGLKYEDIRFEVYNDEELEQYNVFADFNNPNG
ncbi:MAG: hypothetical protein ACQEXB_25335 [Bacillota bacterium]